MLSNPCGLILAVLCRVATVLLLALPSFPLPAQTALDDYVATPDPAFAYSRYHLETGAGFHAHFLQLDSLDWRFPAEVDRTRWQHELVIYEPWFGLGDNPQTVLLLINGGDNGGTLTRQPDEALAGASALLGRIVVDLRQIPNQPLSFPGDSVASRSEDALLAYGMDRYLDTGDAGWIVQLPMVKAVVAAMDAVSGYLAGENIATVDDYILLGGSKRGWAAWLTAAVDGRVRALVPASIDLLNMQPQFRHHWEAYGFYAPAIGDYVAFDLPCRMGGERGQTLLDIIDPYRYRARYADMPKLIANAAGDQFFLPDSARFYYDGLPDPKWLRYTPNVDHGQNEAVILAGVEWADAIADGERLPAYQWSRAPDGTLTVTSDTTPRVVRLWRASNPTARDFRLETLGAAWTGVQVAADPDNAYRVRVTPPGEGWIAFFVELEFAPLSASGIPQRYTTEVFVVPDTLPYAGTHCVLFQDGFE